MLKLRGKILIILALLSVFLIFNSHDASAESIDQKLAYVFNKHFNVHHDKIIGGAVVNVQTGEIMAAKIFDQGSMNGQEQAFSASLTNIIRSISRNLAKMNYDFSWAGIRFDRGVFYLKLIDSQTFVGCFFKPDFNPQEARITLLEKVVPEIKQILY